ncbi:MAG: YdaS family helix-turn-helix protein [Acetobacter pasteurianus]
MTHFVNVMHILGMELRDVIKAAGGCMKLAEICGLRSHTTPIRWKRVPPHHVVAIEQATGIPREELRPDIFLKAESTGVAA